MISYNRIRPLEVDDGAMFLTSPVAYVATLGKKGKATTRKKKYRPYVDNQPNSYDINDNIASKYTSALLLQPPHYGYGKDFVVR